MKITKKILIFSALLSMMFFASCKTQYEQIRTHNDPKVKLKEADRYYKEGNYFKAQTLYEDVIPSFRGGKEAEGIFYNFAYCHFYTGQYILAGHYFKNFANTYFNSPKKEEADYMSAFSNYKLSPNYKLDQSYSQKAIDGFQLFMNTYPESDRVQECNDLIDDIRKKMELKAYSQGKLYYDLKHHESSIRSFENMLKDFPETKKAEEIRFLIAKSSYDFATNSVFAKKQERFNTVLNKCKDFRKKFPRSKYDKEINKFVENSEKELKKINNG